jgi:hypothetical protein
MAALAVTDPGDGVLECVGDAARAVAVVLQQMPRHPLRRLDADAGQPTECLDETFERRFCCQSARPPGRPKGARSPLGGQRTKRAWGHQNGSFMPGGKGIPAVSLPIFSGLTGSTHAVVECGGNQVLKHVLVVAEEARVDGDPFDVVLAGHRHLHEPAPDWPSTSIAASSSCAFFRLSCIACAASSSRRVGPSSCRVLLQCRDRGR